MMGDVYHFHHTVILDLSMNVFFNILVHVISPKYSNGLVLFFNITNNSNKSIHIITQYLKYDWQTYPYGFADSITSTAVTGGGEELRCRSLVCVPLTLSNKNGSLFRSVDRH